MLDAEKEKSNLKKIVLLLIKKIDKCGWTNHTIHGINYYEFAFGSRGYKLILMRSIVLKDPPAFISIKQNHNTLLDNYYNPDIDDLYDLVNKKYNFVERERKKRAEETIDAIMNELNKI